MIASSQSWILRFWQAAVMLSRVFPGSFDERTTTMRYGVLLAIETINGDMYEAGLVRRGIERHVLDGRPRDSCY